MESFQTAKTKLLTELSGSIQQFPTYGYLHSAKQAIEKLQSHQDLSGQLSHLVVDQFDYSLSVGEKIINFENYFRDKTNLIISEPLRILAKKLKAQGNTITFFGKAWSNPEGNWIYFDTQINTTLLAKKLNFPSHITVHENIDPKSGLERGFFDEKTGEGVMGRLK